MSRHRTSFLALCFALLSLCATPIFSQTQSSTVTGSITYRQRMALPPSAVVRVELVDASRADAHADVLALQVIEPKGKQVPIPFSLSYDAGKIQPNHDYRVQAQIMIGGRLAFTSTQAYSVLTRGKPSDIAIVVEPVPASSGPVVANLEETKWTLVEINRQPAMTGGRGEPPYLQLTASGKRVTGFSGCNRLMGGYALIGDRLKFNQVGGTRMACPGDAMMTEAAFLKMLGAVTSYKLIDGKLEMYGDGQLLARFQSSDQAASQPDKTAIENVSWTLTQLNGKAVTAKTRDGVGNLRLDSTQRSAAIFVGCNGMGGSYTLNGDKLKFEQIIGTMMFCNEEAAKMEKAIGDALGAVTSYKLNGKTLELYGNGKLLARFETK